MQFHRFTKYSVFSNWGWYSPKERQLLDKEIEVGTYINSLEQFIRQKPPVKALLVRFRQIQTNSATQESQYDSLLLELDMMVAELKEIRLNVLNRGGKDIPDAPNIFPNHQPAALIGEIQSYLAHRRANRNHADPFIAGFVIHYQADLRNHQAANFHRIMGSGGKVLYTVDVDGHLSVGDPRSTKHSVVAAGKVCKAAGIAQLEIDDRTDMYSAMLDYQARAGQLQLHINTSGDDAGGSRKANLDYLNHEAEALRIALAGWVPPQQQHARTVVIDFDSGHYAPSQAWKEAMSAWQMAGYKAKWSSISRRV